MSKITIRSVDYGAKKEFELDNCRIHEKSDEWSKIIQRLSAVGMWPQGPDGIALALNLVGITVKEVNDETTD